MLDSVSRQIISILQRNGRASSVQVAKEVGISPATVRRRIAVLEREGVMRVVAMTDPFAVGLGTPAYIHLDVKPGTLDAV